MGPLRIFGTTSRLDCSRQLRMCVAQLSPIVGIMKAGGGMNMWKRPLLPSEKLSRPGRLVKASYDAANHNARHAVHHAHQEADKMVFENIDPKSSEVYRLANQFRRENADVGDKPVKNDAGEMSMSEDPSRRPV